MDADGVLLRDRLQKGPLKIGAVDEEIGRAPAPLGVGQRHQGQRRAIASTSHPDRFGGETETFQALDDIQLLQNGAGVRRQLKSGADLLKRRRGFENADPPAGARKTQRRAEAADFGAGDQRMRLAHKVKCAASRRRWSRLRIEGAFGGNASAMQRRVINVVG